MRFLIDFYIRNRKSFLILWTSLLLLIGIFNFYFILEVTYSPNDECIWKPVRLENGDLALRFENVKFEGVTWNAGIRDGDILREVEGVSPKSPHHVNLVIINSGKDFVIYTVERNGEVFRTRVEIKRLLFFNGMAVSLFSLIWLIVGFLVVQSKPNGKTQLMFYRIGVAFMIYSAFNIVSLNNGYNPLLEYPNLYLTIDLFQLAGLSALPFLMLNFFFVFPVRYKFTQSKIFRYSFTLAPFVLFGVSSYFMLNAGLKDINYYKNLKLIQNMLSFGILLIFVLISFILLIVGYSKLKGRNERVAVFVIIISFIVAFITGGFANAFVFMNTANAYNSPEYLTMVLLICVVPIAFGFAVFRYSLMDVSDVIKNALLYGFATVTVAALYFGIIYFLGQEISKVFDPEYQGAIAGIIFILFAAGFQTTKDRLHELITAKIYPEQFAYQQILMRLSNHIYTIVGKDNILNYTQETIAGSLQPTKFAILIKMNDGRYSMVRSQNISINKYYAKFNETEIVKYIESKKRIDQSPVFEENDFSVYLPEATEFFNEEDIHTVLPLELRGTVIGFILIGLKHSGSKYSGKDIELLMAASNQIALALENARLYESEAEKFKYLRDLDNAKQIQESFLPQHIPYIKGFDIAGKMITAMHVGGDYYDVIKVSDSKFFTVIGDVSGKGLSASFYMSKLQTMIKLYCKDNISPKEVLTEINRNIFPDKNQNWFITVTLALFNLETGKVTVCRAGHTPLLLLTGNSKIFYQPAGIGLALDRGPKFEQALEELEIKFEKGEVYHFYSDGISEAVNPNYEFFGEERIKELLFKYRNLPAEQMQNQLLEAIRKFRKDAEQNDDITSVIVKVTE